jgi:hypothetical protein
MICTPSGCVRWLRDGRPKQHWVTPRRTHSLSANLERRSAWPGECDGSMGWPRALLRQSSRVPDRRPVGDCITRPNDLRHLAVRWSRTNAVRSAGALGETSLQTVSSSKLSPLFTVALTRLSSCSCDGRVAAKTYILSREEIFIDDEEREQSTCRSSLQSGGHWQGGPVQR